MGYCITLIPAQHVKAFVCNQKNDTNDALAICETTFRPSIHFVYVKTTEQQYIKALQSIFCDKKWQPESENSHNL